MISKPDLDDRNYLVIKLTNDLQVLLVSDPTTDKAAAALDVNVGHLSDPPKIHGLAHFCEHLLFMGTEKYPSENEYSQFLTSHGGSSNAFTSEDHTNYFFDVQSTDLKPALDRFSQFFKKPLFPESCNDRELLAVDSEHKKNIQSDPWRFYQVIKDLCDPEHPFSGFGTGNLKTLKQVPEQLGLNIRDVLVDFHSKYYSSNVMKLVIVGKESLEVLQGYATEMFSGIPNKNIEAPRFGINPMKKESLSSIVRIKSVKDMKYLSLTFPCIDELGHYKTHPFHYLGHLIGHEGPGSILSLVKQRGLANTLSAGLSRQGARGFDMFRIGMELTEKGLEEYQSVIEIVFQYIELMKRTGCLEWVFQECANVSQMQFRFIEKSSPSSFCSNIAKNMVLFV
jgi:insulysin